MIYSRVQRDSQRAQPLPEGTQCNLRFMIWAAGRAETLALDLDLILPGGIGIKIKNKMKEAAYA